MPSAGKLDIDDIDYTQVYEHLYLSAFHLGEVIAQHRECLSYRSEYRRGVVVGKLDSIADTLEVLKKELKYIEGGQLGLRI